MGIDDAARCSFLARTLDQCADLEFVGGVTFEFDGVGGRRLDEFFQMHPEDEIALAVGQISRDLQNTFAANVHANNALIPSFDDLTSAHDQLKQSASAP